MPNTSRAGQARPRPRRRRRRNMAPVYLLLAVLMLAVVVILSLTVLFKAKNIEVEGLSRYTVEEVLQTAGLTGDENLLLLDEEKIEQTLCATLLYIESVEVRAQLPATLHITVQEAEPFAALADTGFYWVVSKTGKVLEKSQGYDQPAGTALLIGALPPEKSLEEYAAALEIPRIRFVDERTQAAFTEIVSTVDEMQLGRITAIRAADYIDLAFVLEDRVKVLLGNSVDLDYKLKFVRTILQEQVGEGQLAVINARESGHVSLRTTGVTQEEIYLE